MTTISLRSLPSIDRLLKHESLEHSISRFGVVRVKTALRDLQSRFRQEGSAPAWAGEPANYPQHLALSGRGYETVFNLTGTIIHTNLGRAPLPVSVWEKIKPMITRPVNLEYDLDTGRRGHRDQYVADRLAAATGAEAACIVNNNAAALLLVLNTFALGQTVPVSRGELIEIGGSFRLPDIMTRSGCHLLEVGTTNRTHAEDFSRVAADAAMLLKVHPSNYHMEGFTRTVTNQQMKAIAEAAGIPFCVDLGSGTLVDLQRFGLPHEPTPAKALAEGADLVTFSGDKLLGSVQAGLIVGSKVLIDTLNTNPLKRALRADKIVLTALSATLELYDEPDTLPQTLPILAAMTAGGELLNDRAERVCTALTGHHALSLEVCSSEAQIGSGALPDHTLPSVAVRITTTSEVELVELAARLRSLPTPVIGRVHQSALWLDMRCAHPMDELIATLGDLS